jgi:ADP-heptose:LPS heptosyltransferase
MKILLLRFSSIGDIVLTTPVARCISRQTGAEVHFLTKNAYKSILTPNPHIQKVYAFEREVTEVLPALRAERYDEIIDLHHNLRSFRVKMALGRPSRSFQKLNFQKWLLVNLGIDLLPKVHIVQRYMDAVRHLKVQYDGAGLDYFVPAEAVTDVSAWSPHLAPGRFYAFVIGATHATKRLPEDKIIAICKKNQHPTVLLGGPSERASGARIAAACGDRVVDLCGQLTLHQSASVVQQSAKVYTHDTGLMHIAAAFQKEIVSFWGSTVPQFGMYPFYPEGINRNTTMEVTGLSCRPCSKIGYDQCPKGHFKCMREINYE